MASGNGPGPLEWYDLRNFRVTVHPLNGARGVRDRQVRPDPGSREDFRGSRAADDVMMLRCWKQQDQVTARRSGGGAHIRNRHAQECRQACLPAVRILRARGPGNEGLKIRMNATFRAEWRAGERSAAAANPAASQFYSRLSGSILSNSRSSSAISTPVSP